MQNVVQEVYRQQILPLSEKERLKLVELIVRDISNKPEKNGGEKKTGGIREMFGTWKGTEPSGEEYKNLDHNERIDFDLARAYADNHEDED